MPNPQAGQGMVYQEKEVFPDENACAVIGDEAKFVGAWFRDSMDRHGVHAGQKLLPKRAGVTSKSDFFIALVTQEPCNRLVRGRRLRNVPRCGVPHEVNFGPGPEALTQTSEDGLYERLIGMVL